VATIQRAEQNQIAIDKNTASPKLRQQLEEKRELEQERLEKQYRTLNNTRTKIAPTASSDELKEMDSQIAMTLKDLNSSSNLSDYTNYQVEKIKGVDEKGAKKKAAAQLQLTDEQLEERLKNNNHPENAAAKAAVAENTRDKAANVRKTQYARGLEEQRTLGFKADWVGRHMIFGRVKGENIGAAISIRKTIKEKSSKDKLAEAAEAIIKENAENNPEPVGDTPPPPTPDETTPPPATS